MANLLNGGGVLAVDKQTPTKEVDVSKMQENPNRNTLRRSVWAGSLAATLRARLRYANVIASLALFIALGGTAAAAVTLGRDSVGSPQIRQDAVRSPEIVSGGVRSSEIRDEGIKFADVSPAARAALLGDVHVAEDDNPDSDSLPKCSDLSACQNHLVLPLTSGSATAPPLRAGPGTLPVPGTPGAEPSRNWLIQAKVSVSVIMPLDSSAGNQCGLVNTSVVGPRAMLDEAAFSRSEAIALSAVVKKREGNPTIALRCTSRPGNDVIPHSVKITALEVGSVTGP